MQRSPFLATILHAPLSNGSFHESTPWFESVTDLELQSGEKDSLMEVPFGLREKAWSTRPVTNQFLGVSESTTWNAKEEMHRCK